MDGSEHSRGPFRFDRNAALFHYAERPSEERLRGRGAEADDHGRFENRDFGLEPRHARADLAGVGRFVETALRTRVARPLEVLHGVRDIDVVAVDTRGLAHAV